MSEYSALQVFCFFRDVVLDIIGFVLLKNLKIHQ